MRHLRWFVPNRRFLLTSFVANDRERLRLPGPLAELVKGLIYDKAEHYDLALEYFVIVPSGCCFLIRPRTEASVSGFMRDIKAVLARIANHLEDLRGPVFERRFDACELLGDKSGAEALTRLLALSLGQRKEHPHLVCDALDELRSGKGTAITPSRQIFDALCQAAAAVLEAGSHVFDISSFRTRLEGLSRRPCRTNRPPCLPAALSGRQAHLGHLIQRAERLLLDDVLGFLRRLPRAMGEKCRIEKWKKAYRNACKGWDQAMESLEQSRTPASDLPAGFAQLTLLTSFARRARLSS